VRAWTGISNAVLLLLWESQKLMACSRILFQWHVNECDVFCLP
jgi:hypothetical protein